MPILNKTFLKTIKINPKGDTVYWDDEIKGFGLRVQNGRASYLFYYRNDYKRQRKITIGRSTQITPSLAREQAKKILAEVIQGKDPAQNKQDKKHALTVAELCDWYIKEGTAHKKQSTIKSDISRIESHIKPLIGKQPIKVIKRGDIQKMVYDITQGDKVKHRLKMNKPRALSFVRGGAGTASRTNATLSAIFSFAVAHDIVPFNPCIGVKVAPTRKKDVFLTLDEIVRFGALINRPEQQTLHKMAIDCLKLTLLTGCRRGEILGLRWEWVDLKGQCFRFPDTKTGKQNRPFGIGALHLLQTLNPQKEGWVFPASFGMGHYDGLPRVFEKLKSIRDEQGELYVKQELTIHALRHTFASLAADMGYSDFTIAGLLGHSLHTTTSIYTHAVDRSLINAADTISLKIEQALNGKANATAQIIDIKRIA